MDFDNLEKLNDEDVTQLYDEIAGSDRISNCFALIYKNVVCDADENAQIIGPQAMWLGWEQCNTLGNGAVSSPEECLKYYNIHKNLTFYSTNSTCEKLYGNPNARLYPLDVAEAPVYTDKCVLFRNTLENNPGFGTGACQWARDMLYSNITGTVGGGHSWVFYNEVQEMCNSD